MKLDGWGLFAQDKRRFSVAEINEMLGHVLQPC